MRSPQIPRTPRLILAGFITLVTAASAVAGEVRPPGGGAHPPMAEARVDVLKLASVRRLLPGLERRVSTMTEGERVAAWTDVSTVMASVTGRPSDLSFEDVEHAIRSGGALLVPISAGASGRDAAAERLLALGYSAGETADVLRRRITQHALDTARTMIAVGGDRQAAADYLDSQYTAIAALNRPRPAPGRLARVWPTTFDALIDKYAALHRVEASIVRAVIAAESGFNPIARSRAGAIGLMQLMPGTARELGVNPHMPEQNIEGGVRYLSQLLKMFGSLDLALVAYNAGPGFAERYARGQAALYGETREYVGRVLGLVSP